MRNRRRMAPTCAETPWRTLLLADRRVRHGATQPIEAHTGTASTYPHPAKRHATSRAPSHRAERWAPAHPGRSERLLLEGRACLHSRRGGHRRCCPERRRGTLPDVSRRRDVTGHSLVQANSRGVRSSQCDLGLVDGSERHLGFVDGTERHLGFVDRPATGAFRFVPPGRLIAAGRFIVAGVVVPLVACRFHRSACRSRRSACRVPSAAVERIRSGVAAGRQRSAGPDPCKPPSADCSPPRSAGCSSPRSVDCWSPRWQPLERSERRPRSPSAGRCASGAAADLPAGCTGRSPRPQKRSPRWRPIGSVSFRRRRLAVVAKSLLP